MGKNNAGRDKMQAITALILAIITIGSIVLSIGEAKNKLENLGLFVTLYAKSTDKMPR